MIVSLDTETLGVAYERILCCKKLAEIEDVVIQNIWSGGLKRRTPLTENYTELSQIDGGLATQMPY